MSARDNYFHHCPAKTIGRDLGTYKTATRSNEYIKYVNNIVRDDQYRLFLQTNTTPILDREWHFYKKTQSCFPKDCVHNYPLRVGIRQMVQEKQAFDSIYNPLTNKALAPMRKCIHYKDYRMMPIGNQR